MMIQQFPGSYCQCYIHFRGLYISREENWCKVYSSAFPIFFQSGALVFSLISVLRQDLRVYNASCARMYFMYQVKRTDRYILGYILEDWMYVFINVSNLKSHLNVSNYNIEIEWYLSKAQPIKILILNTYSTANSTHISKNRLPII